MSTLKLRTPAGGSISLTPTDTASNVTLTLPASTTSLVDSASLAASGGSALVGYLPAGTGAVATTVQGKLRESVSVLDFGAVGDGVTDDTAAIQAALNSGKSIYFPIGVYLTDPLTIPYAARGAVYFGDGFYHYGATQQTVIKAKTAAQANIFALADGANNITFTNLRIDGDSKAVCCIDGTYGAFFGLENVGVYGSTGYAFKGRQGLARINRVYSGSHAAIGFEIYSDSAITNSEFTGGTEPLRLVAGGNRLNNVWANSGSVSCLTLTPLNVSTTHINTSITNLYTGETLGGVSEVPIVKIQGLPSQLVQQVQIGVSHVVCASAPDKINIGIFADYVRDISVTGVTFLGNSSPTATRYLKNAVSMSNAQNVSICGGVIKHCTKNPIVLGAACYNINVSGVPFSEWATSIAAGTEGAAILCSDANNFGAITGCSLDISGASAVPYFMEGGSASRFSVVGNLLRYSNTASWVSSSGYTPGGWQFLGAAPRVQGQLSGFATYDPPSLVDGAGATTTLTVTGAALGDAVTGVSFSLDLQGIIVTGWVSAANTVSVRFQNESGGTLDLASGTLRARVQKLI